jgi:glycosyltransferase involved in cell wall biosynthesis
MKKNTVEISIIIPVYNEEKNNQILYEEISNSLGKLKKPYEIIFIDDGSSDTTFEHLKNIKNREKNEKHTQSHTRIIRFTRNFGQTAAMQAGFDFAKGEIIVSLDGDLQNDPNDIPMFLTKLDEGYDVVCGWRKDRKDKTLTRIIPSKIANWLIAKITGVQIHDNGCSLKAYRSSVIKSLTLYSDMHRFIPAMSTLTGARIAELVVNHRPRKYGTTKYGLSRTWRVLFDMITIKMLIHFNDRALLWFTILSLPVLICGLIFGALSIALFYAGQYNIIFPAASFLFLSAFGILFLSGTFAEFLTAIESAQEKNQ